MSRRAVLPVWLGLAGFIVVLDQLSKSAATQHLEYGVPLKVLPGFNLTLLHNTGAAFSMFADAAGWQRWFFIAIAVAVSVWVVGMLREAPQAARWMPLALTLVLGGALGNCWDRVALGYVVDFVQLCYEARCFPAFNVADSAITLGATMIIFDMFRSRTDARQGEGRV
jgi:signal peptidase II